ncbi:hypothetical protein [Phenylobacterium sp. LH3H17]|nr:hypothetical protein [Phenylobacterium sp. LH3H17]
MVRAAVLRERGDATPDPLLTPVETIEDLSSARTVDQVKASTRRR